jgi:UDP-2,3-diacylglucosamine pyrophosphatase LpxH
MWQLRRRWYWPNQYNEVVHKLLKRSRKGAKVFYIPGNHGDFFRDFVDYRFGEVQIVGRAYHTAADGRRFLVLHGDEFDTVVMYHGWLSRLGGWAYGYLILLNRMLNAIRRKFGKPYWSLSGVIKRKVKRAVKYLTRFEELLVHEAIRQKVDGVTCGHIHQPAMREVGGITYCNTGDWVKNCTALVEHMDGRLALIWWHIALDTRCGGMPESTSLPQHLEGLPVVATTAPEFSGEQPIEQEPEHESALTP